MGEKGKDGVKREGMEGEKRRKEEEGGDCREWRREG